MFKNMTNRIKIRKIIFVKTKQLECSTIFHPIKFTAQSTIHINTF